MKYRAVVLDVDGTLLNSKLEIELETLEVLKKFRSIGGKVYLATGRTYLSVKPYYDILGLDTPVIAYNGAKVVSNFGETILEYPIEGDLVKYFIDLSRRTETHLNLYQNEKWLVEDPFNNESEIYEGISGLSPEESDFENLEEYFSNKALFIAEKEKLDKLKEEIIIDLDNRVHVTASKPFFLEVMKKGVNKGETLKKIMESEGLDLEEVIAFGDGLNDLEMIRAAGLGVAMGNSYEELKEAADLITVDNDSNGIAQVMTDLFNKRSLVGL
ncbi:Cof-type HAD-IIB family hydrolase [uncultured Ilyobacter sp.]|uniref:Cof-type HAD-IIB family hydrolase n=1 Tax=uncultured Ilyobacter sp. TaxID=544433 RepID=UPI0029C97EDB|nr:Cof-type HAD-IIB family hydrolase [uncultured Ilyobacter sp.]